jgi:4-hydroxy-3-polyprenylbenzoate decarboxylase
VKKRYPGQARKVMYGLWGLGLLMLAKTILVVDEWVNVHDLSEVAWRVTNNIDPVRDLVVVEGPSDDLDHAALHHRYGGKRSTRRRRVPLDRVEQPCDEIR